MSNILTPGKWLPSTVLGMAAIVLTLYMWMFLHAESQIGVAILLCAAILLVIISRRFGATQLLEQSAVRRPGLSKILAVGGGLALIAAFYDSHFILLMLCAVLLYSTACLGLTVQFGYSGVANFAGAAFFGVGSYATAVLATHTGIPHLLIILISGLSAALIGSLLILPVLRTRGHYAALVTIAFGILFKTFIEVNDVLGGPQGLQVPGMELFGFKLNQGFTVFGLEISLYVSYAILSLITFGTIYGLISALERSWVGLSMDVIRTDETAASTFGLHIVRWKVVAFTMGNFIAGVSGGLYGMISGFVAPNNFTFSDSLLMLSIVILGGLGNIAGLIPAAMIVLILPEKLQFIQEYRFLLFATLVILILLFRPQGLMPRKTRLFFRQEES
ncbi:MAG: branched-chain amino acid ABC transporter permease [Gammaproteobacteria bacterium]|nr:branched-chain amino acid ABC transporter permease [Gammaproteobacteria bacterium]MBU0787425.1 branched-chain amino acid ABC transporter permease [Gammaproteobacteria bacterium]MBU0815105.1 branched-chain amino acid ABC transporter permease [Gammaproteobacteria bacterium]MBU1785787.1 branched-chain amino acid ABC transporter permease [Gammaproteobacteria bacterium]